MVRLTGRLAQVALHRALFTNRGVNITSGYEGEVNYVSTKMIGGCGHVTCRMVWLFVYVRPVEGNNL